MTLQLHWSVACTCFRWGKGWRKTPTSSGGEGGALQVVFYELDVGRVILNWPGLSGLVWVRRLDLTVLCCAVLCCAVLGRAALRCAELDRNRMMLDWAGLSCAFAGLGRVGFGQEVSHRRDT